MPDPNAPFIAWATAALAEYDRAASTHTGDKHCGLTDEGQMQMLIASLHHLADHRAWNWDAAMDAAARTYEAEREKAGPRTRRLRRERLLRCLNCGGETRIEEREATLEGAR